MTHAEISNWVIFKVRGDTNRKQITSQNDNVKENRNGHHIRDLIRRHYIDIFRASKERPNGRQDDTAKMYAREL